MPLITIQPGETTVEVPPGTLLLAATRAAGREVDAPCGGKGACGKCLVRVVSGQIQPRGRELLSRELAEGGYVLACRTRIGEEPITIEVPHTETHGAFSDGHADFELLEPGLLPEKEELAPMAGTLTLSVPPPQPEDGLSDLDRLTRTVKKETGRPLANPSPRFLRSLPDALREKEGEAALTVSPSPGAAKENEPLRPLRLAAGNSPGPAWGIAIDLGTTTVAALLADLDTGEVKEIATAYNRQVSCGHDVISRINYARDPERLDELRTRLVETVNALAANLAGRPGIEPEDLAAASLLGKVGLSFEEIKTFYVAGGVGRFLDIEDDRKIGLLPALPRQRFRYLGNSSLMGAYLALTDQKRRKRQEEIAQGMTYIDLSNEPTYMDRYTAALFLPHTDLTRFPSSANLPKL